MKYAKDVPKEYRLTDLEIKLLEAIQREEINLRKSHAGVIARLTEKIDGRMVQGRKG